MPFRTFISISEKNYLLLYGKDTSRVLIGSWACWISRNTRRQYGLINLERWVFTGYIKLHPWCIVLAIARFIRQGLSLEFPVYSSLAVNKELVINLPECVRQGYFSLMPPFYFRKQSSAIHNNNNNNLLIYIAHFPYWMIKCSITFEKKMKILTIYNIIIKTKTNTTHGSNF